MQMQVTLCDFAVFCKCCWFWVSREESLYLLRYEAQLRIVRQTWRKRSSFFFFFFTSKLTWKVTEVHKQQSAPLKRYITLHLYCDGLLAGLRHVYYSPSLENHTGIRSNTHRDLHRDYAAVWMKMNEFGTTLSCFFFSFSILLLYLFLYFFWSAAFFISTIGEWIREKLLERLIKGAGQTARHVCCLCVWGRQCRGEESEWQWSNWPIRKAVCHGVCRSQPEPPPVAPTPALLEPFLQSAWMVCLSMCGDGLNAFGKHTCHIFIYIPKGRA